MSSDFFLERIDSSTSMTAAKGPPIMPELATVVNDRFKTELRLVSVRRSKENTWFQKIALSYSGHL